MAKVLLTFPSALSSASLRAGSFFVSQGIVSLRPITLNVFLMRLVPESMVDFERFGDVIVMWGRVHCHFRSGHSSFTQGSRLAVITMTTIMRQLGGGTAAGWQCLRLVNLTILLWCGLTRTV